MGVEKETQVAAVVAETTTTTEVVVVEVEEGTKKEIERKEDQEVTVAVFEGVETGADVACVETGEKEESLVKQSLPLKEESNKVEDLVDPEKKALGELKELILAALAKHEFSKPTPEPAVEEEKKGEEGEEPKKEEVAEKKEEIKDGEPVKKEEEKEEPEKEEEKEKTAEPCVTEEKEPVVSIPLAAALAVEMKEEEEEDGVKTVEPIEETVAEEVKEEEKKEDEKTPLPPPEEVFIWGIPLIGDEKSDTILLKFLRARDFKVKDALAMIKNTVIWRKEFGIESLLNEDLGVPELDKVVFTHGLGKEGNPVCYNVYGEFQDKDLYQKAFGDEEKRRNFLRWRVQVLEKDIREKLDFGAEGVCSMVQVTDLKNSPGLGKKEIRQATKQSLSLLQDNYPEFVAKQIFINVPWWYLAFNRMIAPLFTPRSKSKFVFAGPSKSAETLFKYIAPEQVPVQYGGLSMENDTEFCSSDLITDVSIKPSTKHTIEIPVTEPCTLVWELRVLGWEVSCGAEFVPDAEGGYTVIIQKMRKFIATDEAVEKNRFKIGEPGKVVITVDNATSKKKKLLYRSKIKTTIAGSI